MKKYTVTISKTVGGTIFDRSPLLDFKTALELLKSEGRRLENNDSHWTHNDKLEIRGKIWTITLEESTAPEVSGLILILAAIDRGFKFGRTDSYENILNSATEFIQDQNETTE